MTVQVAHRAIWEGQSVTQDWSRLFPQPSAVPPENPAEMRPLNPLVLSHTAPVSDAAASCPGPSMLPCKCCSGARETRALLVEVSLICPRCAFPSASGGAACSRGLCLGSVPARPVVTASLVGPVVAAAHSPLFLILLKAGPELKRSHAGTQLFPVVLRGVAMPPSWPRAEPWGLDPLPAAFPTPTG